MFKSILLRELLCKPRVRLPNCSWLMIRSSLKNQSGLLGQRLIFLLITLKCSMSPPPCLIRASAGAQKEIYRSLSCRKYYNHSLEKCLQDGIICALKNTKENLNWSSEATGVDPSGIFQSKKAFHVSWIVQIWRTFLWKMQHFWQNTTSGEVTVSVFSDCDKFWTINLLQGCKISLQSTAHFHTLMVRLQTQSLTALSIIIPQSFPVPLSVESFSLTVDQCCSPVPTAWVWMEFWVFSDPVRVTKEKYLSSLTRVLFTWVQVQVKSWKCSQNRTQEPHLVDL